VKTEPTAFKAWAKDRMIYIELTDFRIIAFPAARFKLLKDATDEQLLEQRATAGAEKVEVNEFE
jgi:hypothetical protein